MKSNLIWFFKTTTITSYLKITSKIQEKGPIESLKGSYLQFQFHIKQFPMCSQKIRKTTKHLLWEKKVTKYIVQLYTYSATFYGFHVFKFFSKSVSQIQYILPLIVVEAVIMHKICLTLPLRQNIYQQQITP